MKWIAVKDVAENLMKKNYISLFTDLSCPFFAFVTGCKNVQLCRAWWQWTLIYVQSAQIYIYSTCPSVTKTSFYVDKNSLVYFTANKANFMETSYKINANRSWYLYYTYI